MLHIVRGARLDRLLDAMLASMARQPLPPPMHEIVVIQGRGLDRWISQQAALRQGGWGFVETLFPRPFLLRAFSAVLDGAVPTVAQDDGVMGVELELRVAALLPTLCEDPTCASIFAPVAAAVRPRETSAVAANEAALALAPRIADVLDRAAQHRVDRVVAWQRGELTEFEHADEEWLAELWRRISADSKPSRLICDRERFIIACGEGGGAPPGLPARVSIFGVSTLAPAFLELLEALAHRIEVTVYALDPCPGGAEHPLARSWGVESIEFAAMIDERVRAGEVAVVTEDAGPPPADLPGLLALAQSRVRGEQSLPPETVDEDDTLILRPCSGALHEIETAHDVIASLLRSDASLEPRDVAILTPDLEKYGPIVEAVFGARRDDRARPILPFAVADHDRVTAQVVDAFAQVIELALSRCDRARALHTLALEPISRAFELGASDLEVLEQWCDLAQIRWGLDAHHRAAHGRPGETVGTWQWGIDRLHLGSAVADGTVGAMALSEPVAPVFAVEGSGATRLASLQSFMNALAPLAHSGSHARPLVESSESALAPVNGSAPGHDWLSMVEQLADRVLSRETEHAAGAAIVRCKLAALRSAAQSSGFHGVDHAIGVRPAMSFILSQLRDAHPGRGLLASGVTIAALQPMRSIPFRVIVLVGMAEGAIPRASAHASFDLVAAAPRRGDRTPRLDDRQVMLETLFAASRSLVLTWPGIESSSGRPAPASVLVDELLEVMPEAKPRAAEGAGTASEAPLDLVASGVSLAPHAPESRVPNAAHTALRTATLNQPPSPTLAITLDELEQFWKSPARGHLRAIGVQTEWSPREAPLEDPIGGEYEQDLLRALMPLQLETASEAEAQVLVETPPMVLDGRGWLPRGSARDRVLRGVREMLADWTVDADAIARGAGAHGGLRESFTSIAVDIELPIESARRVRVTGIVPALHGVGPLLLTDRSRAGARIRLIAWLRLLAVSASGKVPGVVDDVCHALILERKPKERGDAHNMSAEARLIPGPSQAEARTQLAAFVQLMELGRREPIAFMPTTSLAYAHHCEKQKPEPEVALEKARHEFAGERGDGQDSDVRVLFGPDRFFDATSADDPHAFVALAERLARPILRAFKSSVTTAALRKRGMRR